MARESSRRPSAWNRAGGRPVLGRKQLVLREVLGDRAALDLKGATLGC